MCQHGDSKYRNGCNSDSDSETKCARLNCSDKAVRSMFITVHGMGGVFKFFCEAHLHEEIRAERQYERGL